MNVRTDRGSGSAIPGQAEGGGPQASLVWGGALASLLCLGALGLRAEWLGRPTLLFLAWNLLLAWTPLAIDALRAQSVPRLRALGAPRSAAAVGLVLDAGWLLFLPNAPYLVTDLVHLGVRPPVPFWFDLLLYCAFAATGCWLGLVSLESVLGRVSRWAGPRTAQLGLIAVSLACGYGVYLGRFLRFNSWDVLVAPAELLTRALHPLATPFGHPRALGFTLAFALFFGVQAVLLRAVRSPVAGAR